MLRKLLTLGCSHSSTGWGRSWPDFLANYLNLELIRASSPGAGNAFFIEKLHEGVKEFTPNLAVIQLTCPSRVVTGAGNPSIIQNSYTHSQEFKDMKCYTWNAHNNEQWLGKEYKIDGWWLKNVPASNWASYKILQDIVTMQFLCDKYEVPVVFWSWFIDFKDLFVGSYSWLEREINYIEGYGEGKMREYNQEPIPNDGHYSDEPHRVLVEKWLGPAISKLL